MPIYEFYCPDCHMLFNFFSASVNTSKTPVCPRCTRRPLERQLSRFATLKRTAGPGETEADAAGPGGDVDDTRMERAMEALAGQAEGLDDDDPRQAAQMMRKLSEMAGMGIGPGMEEALRRIEAGEDPEAVENELGDVLENEDPFTPGAEKADKPGARRGAPARSRAPARDEKLYTL